MHPLHFPDHHLSGRPVPTSTPARPPNPKPRKSPSKGLHATLDRLHKTADLVPPLHPAINGLASFLSTFESAARHRHDYHKMASDLDITLQFLQRHLHASTSIILTETINDITRQVTSAIKNKSNNTSRAVQDELGSLDGRKDRSMSGRLLAAAHDEEDLLEVSMGKWHAKNANQMEARLNELAPAKLATYNSKLSEAINRRTCTENTRKNILSELYTWSDDPNAEKVFWMDGMAGTGKTTIACTLAQVLQVRGQLAASFFCTRSSPECRDANRIVPTIVYQLARHSTPFQSALGRAMEKNPDAAASNISAQFEHLLKDPLLEAKDKLPNNMVVVIDALDECQDSQVVSQVLDVFFRFLGDLPVKFLITSRPETAIREKMMSAENVSRSTFHLHDIEQSLVQEDIELYLREELEFMFPSPADVKQLAALAGNLFIYAATTVRYIRPSRTGVDPHERLSTMLAVDSGSLKRFAHIDTLYTKILDDALGEGLEPTERERMQYVLWTAICVREPVVVETLAALVGLNESQALTALELFRSVLHVSEDTGLVSTLHASFPDYMLNQDRSGQFFCDETAHSQLLTRCCMEVMKKELRFNICDLPSSFTPDDNVSDLRARIEQNISPSLSYACRYWPEHLNSAATSNVLRAMVDEFLSQRLLFWMEVLNLTGYMMMGVQGLVKVQAWLRILNQDSESIKHVSDAHKFIARFAAHEISLSTPHIYISALPLCPPSSLVSIHYQRRLHGLMKVEGTAIIRLGQAALATWTNDSGIHTVAYSPDGACVASGSWDGKICIRTVHDGKIIVGPFQGHSEAVSSIEFSPDGTRIVSGSFDYRVGVWDARDGKSVVGPLEGHTDWVMSVAFSPDGTRIVSGSGDCTIRVWSADDGTPVIGPFEGHAEGVNSVGYSPDGSCIVSGSSDATIRLWDAGTGALITDPFEDSTGPVKSVAFSPDGERIVCGSYEGALSIWNVRGTLLIGPLHGHASVVESVAFSPNGTLIVSGSDDQTIRIWCAHDGTPASGPFEGHTAFVNSVRFSPEGTHVISGSKDQTIRVWNVSDSSPTVAPSEAHSYPILTTAFSPDGILIASGSVDQTVRVWSALDGTLFAGPLRGHTDEVVSVAFSPDGARIASASSDCTIRVWRARDGTLIAGPFEGHEYAVSSVAFSPDGLRIASGSYDCTICVWDACNGKLVAGPFKGDTNEISSVSFSPDGMHIASGSRDASICIWDSRNGKQVIGPFKGHTEPILSVRFSPDGSHIASSSWDMTICVWDARNGKLISGPFKGHTDIIRSVAFSPDGTLVVSGSDDLTIRFWNTLDGTSAAPPLKAHTASIPTVGFSSDGSVVSGSYDNTIRVWTLQIEDGTHGALADSWTIRDDGWVLNTQSQMLFWVPGEIRGYFPRPNNHFTIGPLGSIQVNPDGMLVGEKWITTSSSHTRRPMDLGSTSSSSKPKRRALARRWFQDLKADLKSKFKSSSHASSRSSGHGSNSRPNSRPVSRHSTRHSSFHSSRPSVHSASSTRRTAWGRLKTTLNELQANASLAPSLKSSIGGLNSLLGIFEAAAKNRRDYENLATDLEITVEFLNQHLKAPIAGQAMERMAKIARSIEMEIKSIEAWRDRSETKRVMGASSDEEDIIERYRRIEQLLYRMQIEASMSTWAVVNEHLVDMRLEKLEPAKLASFDSTLSISIYRRTCTENTRKAILSELNSWSDNPDGKKIYWVDGMAGTGKTTIACTLASELKSRGQLAASFFCTRTSPECRDADRIVPTIAYQLARQSTPFQYALSQVLSEDPDIGFRNISAQFEGLLKEPLEASKEKIANNLVVVVDALDECEDTRVVNQILNVLFRFVGNLPIKFFVTSRPEPAIRERMISPENASKSILHLHDVERSLVQEDIELYLQEELEFMSPPASDVKELARLADNLFIYAATAVRYIRPGRARVDPRERMATMLAIDSKSRKKFAHIDVLYTTILSAALGNEELEPRERGRMEHVLYTSVCAREPIPIETLAELAGTRTEVRTLAALEPLLSVLYISEHTGLVSILHVSFSDYMFTQDRSGQFFCDENAYSQRLAQQCFEIMKTQLRFNMGGLPSSFTPDRDVPGLEAQIENNISQSLIYACQYWPEHMTNAAMPHELCRLIDEFLSERLLFWMEVLNLKGYIGMGVQRLVKVQAWLRAAGEFSDTAKLTSDAHKFVARFASHPISLSTPHIYISALPFCPPSSLVSTCYRQRMQGLIEVKGSAIIRMGQAALATWTTNSPILSAAYSPDGSQIVYGTWEGPIHIRKVHDGKVVVGPLQGHSTAVSSVCFSPDGLRICSGSYDRTIRVWDACEGTHIAGPFEGHTSWVSSVAFSPDGARIVSGSGDHTIRVWDAHNGRLATGPFEGHTDRVLSVGYSPDGTRILSGSGDHTIQVWDANSGSRIHSLIGHTDSVNSVEFSPDGERIVSGSGDCTIRVWDAYSGALAFNPLKGHTRSICSVAYSPNGKLIVSGSADQSIRVWNAHEESPAVGLFEGHTYDVESVKFSPDGAQIVSTSSDHSMRIWNLFDSLKSAVPSTGHTSFIYSAEFSPDGALIASGSGDETIRVWSALDGSLISGPLEGHTGPVLCVAFSPDSTRIVSGSSDHTIRVWHARDGKLVAGPFRGHSDGVRSIALSPDGSSIVSGSDDYSIRMWNASDGTLIIDPFQGHTGLIRSVAFSPDGSYIASGCNDGTIGIWDSFNGSQFIPIFQAHTDFVTCVRFSPNGLRIVSGSHDGTAHIWDARNGQSVVGPFEGHTDYVRSVAFSPDGTLIASGSADNTIRLWDSFSKALVAPPFQGHVSSISAVGFSPDGSFILSCSEDQSIQVWTVRQDQRSHAALADPWDVRDDGWILNSKSQLLFWLPGEIRDYFPRLNNRFTIGPLGSVRVEHDSVLLGEEWGKCWPGT
ncbi:Vegetative incompatibility protein HET-E-1 [Ceratobasidium theobromae]|uniref:Vegetative incompatibility protein HET-E-1 n=1 Tax=Ceratobasidium theobromae TaxID=1582974 RepID=A0A5N5QCB8_9AGAM|nr:Vegetative incompatibility protein HET-E-1 [Ceratobasidium theobromae]